MKNIEDNSIIIKEQFMKFYIGQKVKIKTTPALTGVISSRSIFGKYFWWVDTNKDQETITSYRIHESSLEPIEENKPEEKQMSEFKIGETYLISRNDSPFRMDEKVKIIGYPENMHHSRGVYVVNEKNICGHVDKSNLKPLPIPLRPGQEVWVKKIIEKSELNRLGQVTLCNRYSGSCNAYYALPGEIFIKNAEGQIVPYEGG